MLIYHYDPTTSVLAGSSEADESPAEPGVFLVPAFATNIEPMAVPAGQRAVFVDGAWVLQPIPVPVDQNIIDAPDTLFGGPSIKEIFYGQL